MSGKRAKKSDARGTACGFRLKKTVVMVGMMGGRARPPWAGRSRRGWGVPFLDSDHEIERAANMTIPEIFERDGEPFFREKETQVIARLLAEAPGVLSTGGGAFLRAENRQLISEHGVSVWLNAPLEVLWNRVRHKDTRPLLRTPDPHATLKALYEARVPFYSRADLEVLSDGVSSIDEMVDRVLAALATRPDVLERT
ncbi:shikimate kinase [Jhaorihella thermophila]